MRAIICLVLCLSLAPRGDAESLDERYLAGLRERRLYRLAENFGTDRWARDDLTDRQRADLAVELAVLYTEHALAAPPAARDELWTKAEQVCAAIAERWPDNPRRQLVEVQSALVALARGEQLREEAAGATDGLAPAIEQLRTASWRLEGIAEQVQQQLIDRRMRPTADAVPDALRDDELESLSRNVSLQLSRALRQQAMCFAAGTADRDDALLRAVERLEPLAGQKGADELTWQARVETIACLRELGRLQPAAERIAAWNQDNPPADAAARLAAEQVRVLLAAGRIEAALLLADQAVHRAPADRESAGELALARLEVLLEAWRRTSPADHKSGVRGLMAEVDAIRARHGPYSARRAELLAGRALAASGPTSDADSLRLAARHLYHNSRLDEAVAAYDRAARLLEQNEQPDQAFDTRMSAAAIERTAGQLSMAADRYRQLALRQPQHPRAAEAHMLAIVSMADQLRAVMANDVRPLAAEYEELLAEHLAHWPHSARADDVRWWLGGLLAGRRDWPAAIEVLRPISPGSAHFADAVRTIVDGYEAVLASSADDQDDARRARAATLAVATKYLQPLVTGSDNRWPDQWSELERFAAVRLAKLHLRYGDATSPYAEQLLSAALEGTPVEPADEAFAAWQASVRAMLVVARVRSGQDAAGREYDEAVAAYADLAREHPDDGELQEGYAMLLAQSRLETSLRQALAQWQRVEEHSRRGGPRWRRARQARIELLTRLNQRDEAEKLLRLTRLLYPDWKSAAAQ
jgi:tetratricopeptide (TPR) repeat protein